jgi:hypothetical protein
MWNSRLEKYYSSSTSDSVRCTVRKVETSTPKHFSEFGAVLLPNQSTFVTLSKSSLHIARAQPGAAKEDPPKIEFLVEAKVEPTLNKNARLHLMLDQQLFAFGGSSFRKLNLHLFHLESPKEGPEVMGEWKSHARAPLTVPLQHFTQVSNGNKLYILGETYFDEINDLPCSVHVYDAQTDQWSTPECGGTAPTERTKLLVFPHGKNLYVLTPSLESTYHLHIFDTDKLEWSEQPLSLGPGLKSPPSVRTNGTINVVGDKAVLFGGAQLGVFLHDVAVLDIKKHQWVKTEWSGTPPIGRTDHGSVVLSDSRILVYGGNTHHLGADNSLFAIDVGQ